MLLTGEHHAGLDRYRDGPSRHPRRYADLHEHVTRQAADPLHTGGIVAGHQAGIEKAQILEPQRTGR